MMLSVNRTGLEILEDFTQNCVFVHDDWNPNLGKIDWDQYDTNPFLIGADTCVVGSLQGFGDRYWDYLNKLGLVPSNIVIPIRTVHRLTHNLLCDQSSLDILAPLMQRKRLDISTFYSDPSQKLDELIRRLSYQDHRPRIYPSESSFSEANDRVNVWRLLKKHDIPTPLADVCFNVNEIRSFVEYARSHDFDKVVLKQGHRNSFLIEPSDDLGKASESLSFPLLAEAFYPVVASPVAQFISWKNQKSHLLTAIQNIANLHFVGNSIPPSLTPKIEQEISRILQRISELFSGYVGVFGVDFIITSHNELFVVDINGRFNSSTYPFCFLAQRSHNNERVFAEYSIVNDVPIPDLSSVFTSSRFMSFDPDLCRGILLFNPVVDFATGLLRKWSYLVVGKSLPDRIALKSDLNAMICSMKNQYE